MFAVREDAAIELIGRGKEETDERILLILLLHTLRRMQRQSLQVTALQLGTLNNDMTRRSVGIIGNSDCANQMIRWAEILGIYKSAVGKFQLEDAIQTVRFDHIIIHARRKEIPAAFVALHEVGFHLYGMCLVAVEGIVGNTDDTLLAQSLQDGIEVVLGRGYMLQDDAVAYLAVLESDVTYGKAVEQPARRYIAQIDQYTEANRVFCIGNLFLY